MDGEAVCSGYFVIRILLGSLDLASDLVGTITITTYIVKAKELQNLPFSKKIQNNL